MCEGLPYKSHMEKERWDSYDGLPPCMAACPYGARSFNWKDPRPNIKKINLDYPTRTKGVVEKCNFCEERLSINRPPACVEACKQKAMFFVDLNSPGFDIGFYVGERHLFQRKAYLGTRPMVFYVF